MSTPASVLLFSEVARLPAPSDNVAIATRRLDAGATIVLPEVGPAVLTHTVLLGHRFAVRSIARGEELLSWELPFGRALRALAPGEYVCNAITLDALAHRELPGVVLPREPNFTEAQREYSFDAASFRPAEQVAPVPTPRTFRGFRRPAPRGVGTRNYVVILGTSSRTGGLARTLAARLQPLVPSGSEAFHGVVPIAHTEGGGPDEPNNRAELLRTLAGFMVHANVGAVLALDQGDEPVNNAALRAFMQQHDYPLAHVPHAFLSIEADPAAALARGEAIVRAWLPDVMQAARTEAPIAALKIGVQCGGSDAFSGVSANPLLGQVMREIIRHGGAVNQAETDEMIGAEVYFLRPARDAATAQRFLDAIARFKKRLAWHGASAEGNPSGGNRLRGLYNIVLKSLGAAAKKAPDVRLDQVIDYAEPMRAPGFTFMDSPGNDLESIAGQIGAGCNLLVFTTGNGSVTNFPFVPTIKLTTTTTRHELLSNEMDVNAGAYLDGTPMAELAAATFDFTLAVASGQRTKGELAGHSQVSIWRDWRQTQPDTWRAIAARPAPEGRPIPLRDNAEAAASAARLSQISFPAWRGNDGTPVTDRVGLVIPASLCAAQIARLAAERLNASGLASRHGLSRFVALLHTEGCGFTGGTLYARLTRTFVSYATHPSAAATLFLEHGCEKVPNDAIRQEFVRTGVPRERCGWASVQLDGGIEKVLAKVEAWFAHELMRRPEPQRVSGTAGDLAIGLITTGTVMDATARALASVTRMIITAGGTVFAAENDALLRHPAFAGELILAASRSPALPATLDWAQRPLQPGFHIVATETNHWTENLAGLGACGAQGFLGVVTDGHPRSGHPMLPLWQVTEAPANRGADTAPAAIDLALRGDADADAVAILELLAAHAGRSHRGAAEIVGDVDFQITRGLLGVST